MRISRLWLISMIMLVMFAFNVSAQKPKAKKPVKKTTTEKKTTQQKTTTKTQTKKPAEQKKTSEPPKNQPAISTNKASGNATEDEKKHRGVPGIYAQYTWEQWYFDT
jgi:outer membrane biosynthesis protein TonB